MKQGLPRILPFIAVCHHMISLRKVFWFSHTSEEEPRGRKSSIEIPGISAEHIPLSLHGQMRSSDQCDVQCQPMCRPRLANFFALGCGKTSRINLCSEEHPEIIRDVPAPISPAMADRTFFCSVHSHSSSAFCPSVPSHLPPWRARFNDSKSSSKNGGEGC